MMKKLAVFFAVAIAMSVSAFAQGRDLAGVWTLDAAKTGKPAAGVPADAAGPPKMFIKQTAKDISIAMGREDNAVTFNLDGSESEQKMGKSKMEWKGDKFVATVTGARAGGPSGTALTFYREGAWLVVESPAHGGNPSEKIYYAKAAAAK